MKHISLLVFCLVSTQALPAYDNAVNGNEPQDYANIEILLLESAVDQDGGYSFSFENDDGSKASQEGQHTMIDDEHAVERIRGSYSYNDVNGKPVSLTYTADENGFRPIGDHLPTPPPIPLEILRSLRFLATAKPFVDDQLYDYKPKKKVFRGRQYSRENVVPRSRHNDIRLFTPTEETPVFVKSVETPSEVFVESVETPSELFVKSVETPNEVIVESAETPSEVIVESVETPSEEFVKSEETPSEVFVKSIENDHDNSKTETTSQSSSETSTETTTESIPETTSEETSSSTEKPAVESALDVLNESKKMINDALKETIEKTSKITQAATKETAAVSVAAVREEAAKLTENVKMHVTKINEKLSGTGVKIEKEVKQSRDVIDEFTDLVSDVVDGEPLIEIAPSDQDS